ncbi:MAG: tRNA uracil 4-sulfurtransferase ThiI [Halarsenatibacteraceae bacterium]
MYKLIIVRYGEMGLKGHNFSKFADALEDDLNRRLKNKLDFKVDRTFGRFFLYFEEEKTELSQEVIETLKTVPGIVSFSPAVNLEPESKIEDLSETAFKLFQKKNLALPSTFRVRTNRANKGFPLESPQVSRKVCGFIHEKINQGDKEQLSVDLDNPDTTLELDIRKSGIYLFIDTYAGTGGLPVGSAESALLLLSGGIDSPVAGWEMIRRGVKLNFIHFHTPPYTGERNLEKVRNLAKILAKYNGETDLYIVNITNLQKEINKSCHDDYSITILRRMMLRLASRLGLELNAQALITGDSVGQVASQTLASLRTIGDVAELPLLRPLITRDKDDIIKEAKTIGTYETSTLPFEDCCSLFLPDTPITRPRLKRTEQTESNLDFEPLIEETFTNIEKERIQGEN